MTLAWLIVRLGIKPVDRTANTFQREEDLCDISPKLSEENSSTYIMDGDGLCISVLGESDTVLQNLFFYD